MMLIFKKSFLELFQKRKVVAYAAVSMAASFVASLPASYYSNAMLETELENTMPTVLYTTYLWTVGLPLLLFVSLTAAGSLSKEIEKGTMLMLVTKPIRKRDIIIGKMAAYLLFFFLISSFTLFGSLSLYSTLASISNFTFTHYMSLFVPFVAYASILIVFFASLSVFASALTSNTMRSMIIVIVLVVFILFGSDYVRSGAGANYEGLGIYNVDLKYHFGKTLYNFVGYSSPSAVKQWFGYSFGILDSAYSTMDQDQSLDMGSSYNIKHYPPFVSILMLIAAAAAMFFLSVKLFERKEIYGVTTD